MGSATNMYSMRSRERAEDERVAKTSATATGAHDRPASNMMCVETVQEKLKGVVKGGLRAQICARVRRSAGHGRVSCERADRRPVQRHDCLVLTGLGLQVRPRTSQVALGATPRATHTDRAGGSPP